MIKFVEKIRLLWRLCEGRVRAAALRLRGASIGRKTTIGRRFHVSRPWCLQLGERVLVEDDVYLKIDQDDALLQIGDFAFIGRGCEIDVIMRVSVGSHALIAPDVFITDHNHDTQLGKKMNERPCVANKVVIGSDVWIGTKATILPGVTVHDGGVVGANSAVTKDVAANSIVAGVPAKPIGSRR